jgi:hypothetical protein
MKMKSQRKAQRDREKRTSVATRRIDPRNDNEPGAGELDDVDLDVARSLQGCDE